MVLPHIRQPLFGLFYVMTEGMVLDSGFAILRKVIFLLFVDVFQVLRVMTSFKYGWTDTTTEVFNHIDIVYVFTSLMSKLIPRYSFFILAAIAVIVALTDAWYVVQLFQAGMVSKMWPVKMLRALVAALVTTLFSSMIKWLLIPIDCIASTERSLSSFIDGDECEPWSFPEIIISIPTILLAACYICFAMTTSFLSFEINPLSRHPMAQNTGRVECTFTVSKVLVTILVYFSDLVTPVAVAAILFLAVSLVLHKHLTRLPFHSHLINNIRGGIISMVWWQSASTVVVAGVKTAVGDGNMPAWNQTMQWVMVGLLPVAFIAGFCVTSMMQRHLKTSLNRLRGDFERMQEAASGEKLRSPTDAKHSAHFRKGEDSSTDSAKFLFSADIQKRGVFEKFFDTEWESRRRFKTDHKVINVLRTCLYQRSQENLPFMQYLLAKGLEEHPESANLQTVQLIFTRFIFRDSAEFSSLHQAMKLSSGSFLIDHQYVMYAAQRKNSQEFAGQHLGKGTVSAISLMEFDTGMTRARKAHMQCITQMKHFWKNAKKNLNKSHGDPGFEEMIAYLEKYEVHVEVASREYEALTEKYPQSVRLLRAYAHFADTVLNDAKMSEAKLTQANTLEEDSSGKDGASVADEDPLEQKMERSTTSSMNEPFRIQVQQFLLSHREAIMGNEFKAVTSLHQKLKGAICLLVILATSGFVLTDFYLFNDVALRNMDLIDKTGLFRAYATSSNFLLRTQMIAAFKNDTKTYQKGTSTITSIMDKMRVQHWDNYEGIPPGKLMEYYLDPGRFKSYLPLENQWIERGFNYWNFANDYAHRITRAGNTPMAEMADLDLSWSELSEERAGVLYAYENTQKAAIPIFEELVLLYEAEVYKFGDLTTALVSVNAGVNSVLVILIAFFVLKSVRNTIQTLKYKYVACCLALTVPQSVASQINKYYDELETNMKIMEDEAAQMAQIINNKDNSSVDKGWKSDEDVKVSAVPEESETMSSDDGSGLGVPSRSFAELNSPALCAIKPPENPEASFRIKISGTKRSSKPSTPREVAPEVVPLTSANLKVLKSERIENEDGEGPVPDNVRDEFSRKSSKGSEKHGQTNRWVSESGTKKETTDKSNADSRDSSPEYLQRESSPGDAGGEMVLVTRPSEFETEAAAILDIPEETITGTVGSQLEGRPSPLSLLPAPSSEPERTGQDFQEPASLEFPKPSGTDSPKEKSSGKLPVTAVVRLASGSSDDGAGLANLIEVPSGCNSKSSVEQWCCFSEQILMAKRQRVRKNLSLFRTQSSMRRRSEASLKQLSFSAPPDNSAPPSQDPSHHGPKLDIAAPPLTPIPRGDSGSSVGAIKKKHSKHENREMTEEAFNALNGALLSRQSCHSSLGIYSLALISILVLCIVGMVWPARHINEIVNLASTTNHAGRRRYLTRQCVHFTRELVLNDGWSRLTKNQISSALRFNLQELKDADMAIRMGSETHGIKVGADYRNEAHNTLMYGEGCPWRENPEDCTTPGRDDVARHGLQYLLFSFFGAIEKVLARYGSPPETFSTDFREQEGLPDSESFMKTEFDPEKLSVLQDDKDIAFILTAFAGDVFQGLGKTLQVFYEETDEVLEKTHLEMRAFFAAYVIVVVLFFYMMLFRKTIQKALNEAQQTRNFALRIPSHVLPQADINRIVGFFVPEVLADSDEDGGNRLDTQAHNLSYQSLEGFEPKSPGLTIDRRLSGSSRRSISGGSQEGRAKPANSYGRRLSTEG